MGLYITIVDTTNKTRKLVAYPGFQDVVETVSGSSKTTFALGVDIDANHVIDVSIDGRYQPIENVHWTRDTDTNEIIMSESINVGSTFKARIYLK